MGLLDKTNPHATPRSVLIAAMLGSVGFALFAAIASWWKDFESSLTLLMVVFMTVMGAGVGATLEWQVYDKIPDDEED